VSRRWVALVAYTAAIYATVPFGAGVGTAALGTAVGAWVLGPGIVVPALLGAAGLLVRLGRRGAPAGAYAALAAAAAAYALLWGSLDAARLERAHLAESGVAAWLAWWALEPYLAGGAAYAAAAALAAAIGAGEECLQAIVPGRVFDPRDLALNAAAAVLGVVVLGAARAGAQGRRRSSMRGNGIVSRTWCSPQSHATQRSTPMPKPACGTEP